MRAKSNARSLIIATLALFGILLSGNSVLAEDYSIDFGAETPAGRDAGTVTCRFGDICHGNMDSLGLDVSIDVFRGERERAFVNLYGRDLSSFYFTYAADSIVIDTRKPLSREPFFKGARRRGGLFIENERVGTLYLRFHFH